MNSEFLQTDQERRKRVLELLEAAEKNLAYTSQLSGQLPAGSGTGQNGGFPAAKEARASPIDPLAGSGADLPPAPEQAPAPFTWTQAPEQAQQTDENGGRDLEDLPELARTLRMMSQRAAAAKPYAPVDTAQEQAADAPFDQKQPAFPEQGNPEPDTARTYFPLLEKEENAAAVPLESEQTQAAGVEKETPALSWDDGPEQAIEEIMPDLTVPLEQEQAAEEPKKKGSIIFSMW